MEARGATEEGRRGGRRGVDEVTCGRGTTTGIQSLPKASREDTHYPLQEPGTHSGSAVSHAEVEQETATWRRRTTELSVYTHSRTREQLRSYTHMRHASHKIRACKLAPQYTLGLRLTLD